MIDFHSHILPCIDDGSSSKEESIQLLRMLSEQGVTTVAATPHFYANDQSVSEFLAKRQKAYETLSDGLFSGAPTILTGAEVRYYQGISRMKELKQLCLSNTRLLLLEMPMSRWTEYTVKEMLDIANSRNLRLVLAHIERYYKFQSSSVFQTLLDNDVLMQVNATFFTELSTRRRAMKMLKEQEIHFIGSDCHGVVSRPPVMGKALDIIQKRMGNYFIQSMVDYAQSMIFA